MPGITWMRLVSAAALLPALHAAATFDVVGAGIAGTGTGPLAKALDILGYKTYHSGKELTSTHTKWMAVYQGLQSKKDLSPLKDALAEVPSEYNAIVGSPSAFYATVLQKNYPKAKFILTTHEDTKAWFRRSQLEFRKALHLDMARAQYNHLAGCQLPPAEADIDKCIQAYEQHNSMMRNNLKRENLLEFKVTEGWGPLCRFLKVPVPKVPFPGNLKKKPGIFDMAIKMIIGTVVLMLLFALVAMALMSGNKKKD